MTKKKNKILFKKYNKRLWLNKFSHHGNAYISLNIDKVKDNSTYFDIGASIDIADCSRIISLDFAIYGGRNNTSKSDYSNSLRKLNILISELSIFKTQLIHAHTIAIKSYENGKKLEKLETLKKTKVEVTKNVN